MGDKIIPAFPSCQKDGGDGTCRFPDYIPKGQKVWQDDMSIASPIKTAVYNCFRPFVIEPNSIVVAGAMADDTQASESDIYIKTYGLAVCANGQVYLPECKDPKDAGHCGLPVYIHNGKAVEILWKENEKTVGDFLPLAAKYECDAGSAMYPTMKNTIGWCRKDGSMEVPQCVERADYMLMEFKLQNGGLTKYQGSDGRVFAGIVLARGLDADRKPITKWEYSCNDGTNNHAAGSVCRSLGFGTGALMPVSWKMKVAGEDYNFGWTRVGCARYNDTLMNSHNCKAIRYEDAVAEMGMKARCYDFDIAAVKCFDTQFKMDVNMHFSKKKLVCNPEIFKDGFKVNVQDLGVGVRFLLDGKEIQTGPVRYTRKRGFITKVKYNLRQTKFDCASCEIYEKQGKTILMAGEKCKTAT